jgi:hypothetical protein
VPDGQPFYRRLMYLGTPGASNTSTNFWPPLRINEWMASNTGFIRDPADNDADDWFEIYNPTANAVLLTDWSLTDSLAATARYPVPAGHIVPANGYLLVWADGEPQQNSTNLPDLHVNFRLERDGEAIALYAPDGTLIDAVAFGEQTNNVSMGRQPDGSAHLAFFATPTPGTNNPLAPPPSPVASLYVSNQVVAITFTTVPGLSYWVEYKDTLAGPGGWTVLAPAQQATGPAMSVTDAVAGRLQRFYRVVTP